MIAFVTSEQWPDLTADDRLAVREIERRGVRVVPAAWTRRLAWQDFDLVVLRSCWDYHQHVAEFAEWIDHMQEIDARLVNVPAAVRWNLNKRYLLELHGAGVDVIETVFPMPGMSLTELLDERGWTRAVLKPAVSADGERTMLIDRRHAAERQRELDALVNAGGALLQRFVPEIEVLGELSVVFTGGGFSHCVRKLPAAGEFRVQARYGGTAEPWRADGALREQATAALAATRQNWVYARVDGCMIHGRLHVMEVELIEPTLFLAQHPRAAARFAEHLCVAAARH